MPGEQPGLPWPGDREPGPHPPLNSEVLTTIGAIVTVLFGGGGIVAWRKSRVDIAGQLEEYWTAALKREEAVHKELLKVQNDLANAMAAAEAAAAQAAEREQQLLTQIAELSAELAAARGEVAELRAELAAARSTGIPLAPE